MGSSQEKKEVIDFSNTNEGKSIEDLSKSYMDQDIFVCGKYDINFFKNNITGNLKLPVKSNIRYYEKMAKHKDIKDWHFFFAPKVNNFNEMLENTKLFIKEHIDMDESNMDDFNEIKKENEDRDGKIVILYFVDENKDRFLNYFIYEHNQFALPLFIIVGKDTDNKHIKEKISSSINEIKGHRIIDINIFKFSNFADNLETNLINLNLNLIESSEFYNELGDEFKFPKQFLDDKLFDKVAGEVINNYSTLNILICGRAGVGKSTFINGILNATISRSQKGKECSRRIIKYLHRTLPIAFYDTPGMSTEKKMDDIIEVIKKKNTQLGNIHSRIHAVFYLFNGNNTRFFCDFEYKMFDILLKDYKIPIYFLGTQFSSKEEYEENKIIVVKNYLDVTKNLGGFIDSRCRKDEIKNNLFCINMIGRKYTETDKLFEKMYNDFKKYIKLEEITKDNLEEITNENLLSKLKKPQEIVSHPVKLCQHINLIYRLIARSINAKEKGSTFLTTSLLRIISKIFCEKSLSLEECKDIVVKMGFDLDEKISKAKKKYKHWFKDFFGYQTPAEEQISYIAYEYIKKYSEELYNSDENCLKYINNLRKSLNEAINGLHKISVTFKQ